MTTANKIIEEELSEVSVERISVCNVIKNGGAWQTLSAMFDTSTIATRE